LPGALLHNNQQKFICKNVYLKPVSTTAALTAGLSTDRTYKIPIAHGEGRYYADEQTLEGLKDNDQILFAYCSQEGEVTDPFNPNGSERNIAGVCNSTKNVFGMMPHPERAADRYLSNQDGKFLFESLFRFAKS
jgi:phosphoribosylformylglycinamidine synthase I